MSWQLHLVPGTALPSHGDKGCGLGAVAPVAAGGQTLRSGMAAGAPACPVPLGAGTRAGTELPLSLCRAGTARGSACSPCPPAAPPERGNSSSNALSLRSGGDSRAAHTLSHLPSSGASAPGTPHRSAASGSLPAAGSASAASPSTVTAPGGREAPRPSPESLGDPQRGEAAAALPPGRPGPAPPGGGATAPPRGRAGRAPLPPPVVVGTARGRRGAGPGRGDQSGGTAAAASVAFAAGAGREGARSASAAPVPGRAERARVARRIPAPGSCGRDMAAAARRPRRRPWALLCLASAALLCPAAGGECERVGGARKRRESAGAAVAPGVGVWGWVRRAAGGGGSPPVPFNNMAEGPAGAESPPPHPRCPSPAGTARPFVGRERRRLRGRGGEESSPRPRCYFLAPAEQRFGRCLPGVTLCPCVCPGGCEGPWPAKAT